MDKIIILFGKPYVPKLVSSEKYENVRGTRYFYTIEVEGKGVVYIENNTYLNVILTYAHKKGSWDELLKSENFYADGYKDNAFNEPDDVGYEAELEELLNSL